MTGPANSSAVAPLPATAGASAAAVVRRRIDLTRRTSSAGENGFGQVVVGTVLEPGDPIDGRAACRQHEDRRSGCLLVAPHGADDGPPVKLGEHQVEHDEGGRAAVSSPRAQPARPGPSPPLKPSRSRYVRTSRTIFASSSTDEDRRGRDGHYGGGLSVPEAGIVSMVGRDHTSRFRCRSGDQSDPQRDGQIKKFFFFFFFFLKKIFDRGDQSIDVAPARASGRSRRSRHSNTSSDSSAPSHTSASATTTAVANAGGRQYIDRSMTAGGRPSAKRTLPVRSPWISWLGNLTRVSRSASRRDMRDAAIRLDGCFAPGDPIAHRPRIGPRVEECGPLEPGQSSMESIAHGDDVRPPSRAMLAGQEVSRRSSHRPRGRHRSIRCGIERRTSRASTAGKTSACRASTVRCQVRRLEDDVARPPCQATTAGQRLGLHHVDIERLTNVARRWRHPAWPEVLRVRNRTMSRGCPRGRSTRLPTPAASAAVDGVPWRSW